VTRTEPDGAVTVLMAAHEGRRLNSPNDVVVHADGSIWFTDRPSGCSAIMRAPRRIAS
jgi:gluconolactonase